jgi:hypothetical protein
MVSSVSAPTPSPSSQKVGEVTLEISRILGLSKHGTPIRLSESQIKHMEKHRKDFASEAEFDEAFKEIRDIIAHPDFVGLHPKGDSIQFIKKLDSNVLVAVRVGNKKVFWVRTMYPITDKKLQKYIDSGRINRVKP